MIENNDTYHLTIVLALKMFLLALKRAHFGPNWALKWGFGNYINFGSLDVFNIAYVGYFR